MSKSNLHETAYLKLVFQNQAMENIGDTAGIQPSAVDGFLYVSLWTTDPTDSDTGTEAIYTGYARFAIPRSVLGWSVIGNVAANIGELLFPVSLGVAQTITHFGVHTDVAAGDLIGSGSLTGGITIDPGETPRFQAGLISITEK